MNMTDSPKKTEELKLNDELQQDKGEGIADMMRMILTRIGEDPSREGLRRTPERFERALRYLTSGYHQDPEKVLNGAMFSVSYDQMVVVTAR